MKVKVYAKFNLTLNVLGRHDGFHNIDSVVTSVDVFDVVEVVPRFDGRITVAGMDNLLPEQNAAYKAAKGFIEYFSPTWYEQSEDYSAFPGADITIKKGIPMGAGMGGSSADAAAVIYALCNICNENVNSQTVHDLCSRLGSDINYMLFGGLARMRGKGDKVERSNMGGVLYFALTTFDTSMSAAAVYSQFDKLESEQVFTDNGALLDVLTRAVPQGISQCFNNHLQQAASSLSDYASEYLQFCKQQGLTPNMTGSGSAYYVAFVNEQSARNAVNLLNSRGFNTTLCRSVPRGIEII